MRDLQQLPRHKLVHTHKLLPGSELDLSYNYAQYKSFRTGVTSHRGKTNGWRRVTTSLLVNRRQITDETTDGEIVDEIPGCGSWYLPDCVIRI
jgi:hypothetical protein